MKSFIETTDEKFDGQLVNYTTKLPNYAGVLDIHADTIASLTADSHFFSYARQAQLTAATFALNITAFKALARGGNGNEVITVFPAIPDFGIAPPVVAANVQQRFSNHAQILKLHANYTEAIGKDLGIVGAASTFNPAIGKPIFTIELSNGGYPHLKWTKAGFDGVEIWKNMGSGFMLLDKISKSDMVDKNDLPAHGSSAIWAYRMIYIYKDQRVSYWSDDVNVTVIGSL